MLHNLDQKRKLIVRAIGVIATTYRLKKADEAKMKKALTNYSAKSNRYQQTSRLLKANAAIAKEKDASYVVYQMKNEVNQ